MIKVKGLQVAPAELEALLLDHPDVQDVAVIGVTAYVSASVPLMAAHANRVCSHGEELPRAYVMPQSPERATPEVGESIKSWLAERVSRHKRLEGGVHFIDAVPKNPSGKILRKALREKAALEETKAKL